MPPKGEAIMCKAVSAHVALPLVGRASMQQNPRSQNCLKSYPRVNITDGPWEFNEKAPLLEATFVLITSSLRESCFLLTLESVQTRDK